MLCKCRNNGIALKVTDFESLFILQTFSKQSCVAYNHTVALLNCCFTLKGIADQQIAPAVEKAFPPRCSDSPGKRMLPKPPPKPKKQTPTTPSIKPIFSNLNPSMQPEIHKVKPNQIKKQQNVANHKIMVSTDLNQSVSPIGQ